MATLIIFMAGIVLNYGFDFFRLNAVDYLLSEQEINTQSYLVENMFLKTFEKESCEALNARIPELQESLSVVGRELSSYSSSSLFHRKNFDYLKRKYFLLEARLFLILSKLNKECGKPYVPILFFYEIDDPVSERQGFILDELNEYYKEKVAIISIDKDYKDDAFILLLKQKYDVSSAPTIIMDDLKFERLMYFRELNLTVDSILNGVDSSSKGYSFDYTVSATGINRTLLFNELENALASSSSNFSKGDVLLIKGRLQKNNSLICSSVPFYLSSIGENPEQDALIFETVASLGCSLNSRALYHNASIIWKDLGNIFRANLVEKLALNEKPELVFNPMYVSSKIPFYGDKFSGLIIGNTSFVINDYDVILSQTDRVFRDWLSGQLNQSPFGSDILTVFSERLHYSEDELLSDVGWHEGGRMKMLKNHLNITHIPAVGTLVAKHNGSWYAVDDVGVFRFEIPLDKLLYPTARFLTSDIAVLIDTHGMNMLVEQAVRNNVDFLVTDCDHPGKVAAASYVSDKGIKVLCFPDKFVFHALGNNISLVGSPPLSFTNASVIVGNRPLFINKSDKIIVLNASTDRYALWYYQTPAQYFSELQKSLNLNLHYVLINDFNQLSSLVDEAKKESAHVIAARVFNSNDYYVLKNWLSKDKNNKLVLFHTSPYPYGFKIFEEFPKQTTFDDPNVIVVP